MANRFLQKLRDRMRERQQLREEQKASEFARFREQIRWMKRSQADQVVEDQQALSAARERVRRTAARSRAIASAGEDTGTQSDHERWLKVARKTLKQVEAEERQRRTQTAPPLNAPVGEDMRERERGSITCLECGQPHSAHVRDRVQDELAVARGSLLPSNCPPEPPMPRRREAVMATRAKRAERQLI